MKNADKNLLPADEGRLAYENRQSSKSNPYKESDWRHEEWWFGWSIAEESDPKQRFDWETDSFK